MKEAKAKFILKLAGETAKSSVKRDEKIYV
jgi:hypothetical protein